MYNLLLYLSFTILLSACNPDRQDVPNEINTKEYKESLIEANKLRVQREEVEIDNYIKRHQWDMEETGTGLRYLIYHEGDTSALPAGRQGSLTTSTRSIKDLEVIELD